MKGQLLGAGRRASLNLELSLLISLLVLVCVASLGWLGHGIANRYAEAAGALDIAGGVASGPTDGTSIDNGDGSYGIGWSGGTPPFQVVRSPQPDLSNRVIIADGLPDRSYTIPESDLVEGDNHIGIIDGDGRQLEDPIVITRTLWLAWQVKSLSFFDPITTAGGVEVHALRLDYFPEGGDAADWSTAATLFANETIGDAQFWQPTPSGATPSADFSDNLTGAHRTTTADASGNFRFYNLTPGYWLICVEMVPFNTPGYGDNALGYSCEVVAVLTEPSAEFWQVNLQPSTEAPTPNWLAYWADEQTLGHDHALCFLNRRTIEQAADLYVSLGYGSYAELNGTVDEFSLLWQVGLLLPPTEGGSYYTLVDGETSCPTGTHLGTP